MILNATLHAIEGNPKIPWVGYKTPQLLEPIVRIVSTTRIQLALHALEPQTIPCRYGIHRLPQRQRRRTHRLSPFAMYAAFPRADYYEDSAPAPRHRRAWRLAGCSRSGARLQVPVFPRRTLGAVGGQLYPWQFWSHSIRATSTAHRIAPAFETIRRDSPGRAASSTHVVRSPYRDVRRRLQPARQSTRVLHPDTCGSLPIRDCVFARKHLTPFGFCSPSFQPRRGSRRPYWLNPT